MKYLIRTLALSSALASTAWAAPQVDVGVGVDVHDLGAMLRPVDRGANDIRMFPPFGWGGGTQAGEPEDSDRVSLGVLQDILVRLHEEQLSYRDATQPSPLIAIAGERRLVVRGSAELRTSVTATLGALESLLSHTSRVRVRRYRGNPGVFDRLPDSATVASSELARLIEVSGVTLAAESTFDVRIGSTARLDLRSPRGVVVDYDVEIAQHASIVDPTVVAVELGDQFVARWVPGADGGHLTLIATRTDAVGEQRDETIENGALFSGGPETTGRVDVQPMSLMVQHQDVVTRGIGLAAHIPTGRILIARTRWNLAGTSGDELLAIDVESEPLELAQAVPVGGSELVVVLRDALASPSVNAWTDDEQPTLQVARGLWDGRYMGYLDAGTEGLDFDLVPDAGRGWEPLGPWMAAMPGRSADSAATLSAARALAPGAPASARVTAVARLGSDVVASFDLPVGDGARSFAFVGRASPRVIDIDVEVATSAAIGDPSVGTIEEGCSITLEPALGSDGRWSLAPRSEVSIRTGNMRRVEMDRLPGGWVDLLSLARLRIDADVSLVPGNARTIGSSSEVSLAIGLR